MKTYQVHLGMENPDDIKIYFCKSRWFRILDVKNSYSNHPGHPQHNPKVPTTMKISTYVYCTSEYNYGYEDEVPYSICSALKDAIGSMWKGLTSLW